MTSKKYTLLAGLGLLVATVGSAQTTQTVRNIYGVNQDVTDANLIPQSRIAQHNDFLAGTYDYPAKPRDMWEVGIKGGNFSIQIADVNAQYLKSWGFGGHIRKALGHSLSLRLEYVYGIAKGLNWRPSTGYWQGHPPSGTPNGNVNSPWNAYKGAPVFYNYKTVDQDLSLQILANIGNIRFYKAQTGINFYVLGGVGFNTYCVKSNVYDGDNTNKLYNFTGITSTQVYKNRKDVLKELKNLMDKTYESGTDFDESKPFSKALHGYYGGSATLGAGVAFRLTPRVNLAIEDRIIYNNSDVLDGVRWTERNELTPDKDAFNYLSVGLNFNLGNFKKRTEPLYWVNPLGYAYSEIRNPRLMNIPDPILPDTDGDGVIDQFDLEPNTPKGAPVDTHGVALDTDGDGVPDYRDKQKITPTYCFPVDADGVGTCPCPEGCGTKVEGDCATLLGALPSVSFKANSNTFTTDAPAILASVAAKLRNNPGCKVVVVGYCGATKKQQQLSWDHVNKVINHLVEKEGISRDRFIFSHGQEGGDCNTVDFRAAGTGEEGPNTVAPPHPQLRQK